MKWAVLIGALFLVFWGWRNPKFLIPFLIASLPLEISRTWFPEIYLLNKLGEFIGVIDLGRIAALTLIVRFLFELLFSAWERRHKFIGSKLKAGVAKLFANFPLLCLLAVYIILGGLSVIWSVSPMKTVVGTFRLLVLLFTALAIAANLHNYKSFRLVQISFSVVATLLGVIGIFQFITKRFFWFSEVYTVAERSNATFVDANIFARYLLLGIVSTIILLLLNTKKSSKAFLIFGLLIQTGALVSTGSRTGWLAAIVAFFLLLLLHPRRSLLALSGILALGMIIFVSKSPQMTDRLLALRESFGHTISARGYLISAGLEMFREHWLLGVGLGGFQTIMLTQYSHLIQGGVSLSHTALITTAAELGSLGLLVTAAFMTCVYYPSLKRLFTGQGRELLASFPVVAITIIFISAQGEGRFFEDPYLWISVGYLSAFGLGSKFTSVLKSTNIEEGE